LVSTVDCKSIAAYVRLHQANTASLTNESK
jgi:hypothetical protein